MYEASAGEHPLLRNYNEFLHLAGMLHFERNDAPAQDFMLHGTCFVLCAQLLKRAFQWGAKETVDMLLDTPVAFYLSIRTL